LQGSDYETILDSSNHSESSIKISNTSAVTIQDLAILNGRNAGIAITRSDHILLRGLMIDQARSFGVLILRASASVRKSLIRSTLPDLEGNAGMGIEVRSSAQVVLEENLVEENQQHGILVDLSHKVKVLNNLIYATKQNGQGENGYGVSIAYSSDILLENNEITENSSFGIWVQDGSGIVLENNEIMENGVVGVGIGGSSQIKLQQNQIKQTKPDSAGNFGQGIQLHLGKRNLGRFERT